MEQYNLSAKEFLYLCLNAGAKKVYGVENEFKKMSKENLPMEFSNVQKGLVQKRYMRMDFDGNVTLKKDVMEDIQICALCDRAILFKADRGTESKKTNYYFKGAEVICLVWNGEEYLLKRVNKADVLSEIIKELSKIKEGTVKEQISFTVKQSEASQSLKEQNIRKYGCYSIVQVKKDAEKRVQNLLFLETNKGILSVKSKIVGLDNVMDIESYSVTEMKMLLQSLLM